MDNIIAEYRVMISSENISDRLPDRIIKDLLHIKRILSNGDMDRFQYPYNNPPIVPLNKIGINYAGHVYAEPEPVTKTTSNTNGKK